MGFLHVQQFSFMSDNATAQRRQYFVSQCGQMKFAPTSTELHTMQRSFFLKTETSLSVCWSTSCLKDSSDVAVIFFFIMLSWISELGLSASSNECSSDVAGASTRESSARFSDIRSSSSFEPSTNC